MFTLGFVAVLLTVLLISWYREPRRLRIGVYLTVLIAGLFFAGVGAAVTHIEQLDQTAAAWALLGVLVLVLIMVVAFAVFLVATGVTLVRREGRSLSHLLSLALGMVLLAYVAWGLWVVFDSRHPGLGLAVLLGLPAGYLGFAFMSFLLYGSLYPALMARVGGPAAAVVVLGSGLIDGKVPPLLASRLDRGRRQYDRLVKAGSSPLMITSGGRGADEPVAEAEAMAGYLVEDGFPAGALLIEDQSRNTEENLLNTREILSARGVSGPVVAVTSDFHAFRAALLLRRLGMPGYAVGAPTARYYWPSAVIREFLAVLRDHFWFNAVMIGLACLPLLSGVVNALLQ